MDEKENKVTLTQEELNEILGNLPGIIEQLEQEFKAQENKIQYLNKI